MHIIREEKVVEYRYYADFRIVVEEKIREIEGLILSDDPSEAINYDAMEIDGQWVLVVPNLALAPHGNRLPKIEVLGKNEHGDLISANYGIEPIKPHTAIRNLKEELSIVNELSITTPDAEAFRKSGEQISDAIDKLNHRRQQLLD